MAPVISFQDRGHGMTTERRTMAFFMRAPNGATWNILGGVARQISQIAHDLQSDRQ